MENSNQKIIDKYFEAYAQRNLDGIKEVMDENVQWYFLGDHPFGGIKKGIEEVVAFFDQMAKVMGESKPVIEKPIVCENEKHLIECVHTKVNREDGINIDHFACVLWTIENGKIVEGRHFFADPVAVSQYFTAVASTDN